MAIFYSPEIPSPGTSARLRIRLDVTPTIHVDGGTGLETGWDIAMLLRLEAIAAGGFPFRDTVDTTASATAGGSTRVSYGPTAYAYGSSGSPLTAGQLIVLGSNSYFIPVTSTGDLTLTGIRGFFNGGGGTPLGSSSTFNTAGVTSGTQGNASLVLPHIDRGALDRSQDGAWPLQLLERWDGAAWRLQVLERWDGANWIRQG